MGAAQQPEQPEQKRELEQCMPTAAALPLDASESSEQVDPATAELIKRVRAELDERRAAG